MTISVVLSEGELENPPMGTLTRGSVSVRGRVVAAPANRDTFTFDSDGVQLTLQQSEWDFVPDPVKPSPGWYSHAEYPVETGSAPVWVDAEGKVYFFGLSAPDEEGVVHALHFIMEADWASLTPLEKEAPPDAG